MYPRLPVELIVTIAEFLIGDFAFGTAAALNMASQGVHQETLAVLYETLCLDGELEDVYLLNDEVNPGLVYTKFVFIWGGELDDAGKQEALLKPLPNLVVLVSTGYFKDVDHDHSDGNLPASSHVASDRYIEDYEACMLFFHKSCSSHIAFFILKTPVVAKPPRNDAQDTAFYDAPSSFSPVVEIRWIYLKQEATLQERCPTSLRSTTFDLGLNEVQIESFGHGGRPGDEQIVDTVIELAKLAGLQTCSLPRAVDTEEKYYPPRHSHIGWYRAIDKHLGFALSLSAFDGFLEKLDHAAETIPEVAMVMMTISVVGVREQRDFETLLSKLLDFYAKRLTSPAQFLKVPTEYAAHTWFFATVIVRDESLEKPLVPVIEWTLPRSSSRPRRIASIYVLRDGDEIELKVLH